MLDYIDHKLVFGVFFATIVALSVYRHWLATRDERWLEGVLIGMPVKTRVGGGSREVYYWTLETDDGTVVQLENGSMLLRGKTFQEVKSLNNQFRKGAQVRVRIVGHKAEWTYLHPQVLEVQPR